MTQIFLHDALAAQCNLMQILCILGQHIIRVSNRSYSRFEAWIVEHGGVLVFSLLFNSTKSNAQK